MNDFWGYADSVAPHCATRIGLLNVRASRRSLEALFLRPRSMAGDTAGASARRFPLTPVDQPCAVRRPSIGLVGGGPQVQSEDIAMSSVIPLHPANAARAQSLIASVPTPSSPVNMDHLTGELPEILEYVVALILDDFDYDANRRSSTAIAVRILATLAERFEGVSA